MSIDTLLATPIASKTSIDNEEDELSISVIQAAKDTAISYNNYNFDKRHSLFREISKASFNEENFRNMLLMFPELINCRATNLVSLAYDGCLPLHCAALYDNRKAIEILILNGASAWSVDLRGRTPIHIAAEKGYDESCRLLKIAMQKERKIDPIGPLAPIDLAGLTPLGGAVYNKNNPTPKVKSLLFSPGDRTILPNTPKTKRTGRSPWKPKEIQKYTPKETVIYGFSEVKGWSKVMEDRILAVSSISSHENYSLFGVFDGHGGSYCAEYIKNNMLRIVTTQLNKYIIENANQIEDILHNVLYNSCELIEKELRELPLMKVSKYANKLRAADTSGSTAIICLLSTSHFAIANIGDSRAVLGTMNDNICECVPLSTDHKLSIETERLRAELAGATVAQVGDNSNVFEVIVKGCDERLRMSRSIGDFLFKNNEELSWDRQAVVAVPDITIRERSNRDEFIVLACDGIWDVMTNEEVVSFVNEKLNRPYSQSNVVEVCDNLIHEVLHRESQDNLSAIIIAFEDEISMKNNEDINELTHLVNRKLNFTA